MALHQRTHPVAVPGCFGCKIIGVSFGVVPGAYRSQSESYFDRDALKDSLGDAFSREHVEDRAADAKRAIREFTELD